MLSPFRKPRNNEEDINQQLLNTIHKKVAKKNHNHENLKKGDGTIEKCIELFNKGADPNVLIQLEKLLREQEEYQKYYNYYTEKFLPALKTKVIESEELTKPSVLNNEEKSSQRSPTIKGKILGTISGIINKSNAMELSNEQSFSGEVATSTGLGTNPLERDSLVKGVSGKGTPGKYNTLRNSGYYAALAHPTLEQSQLNCSFSQSYEDLENKDPSTTEDTVEVPSGAKTFKLSSGNDSDSGVSSHELSKESLKSPVSSRKSSISSTLSSTEEDNGLQPGDKGEKKLAHLTKIRPKGPSGRRSPSEYREKIEDQVKKESAQCVISVTGSQVRDPMQSEKKEAANYENKSEVKQPNNRNLHVALVTGCALLAIGCIVAGAITSGVVGAGLFAMAAVFAIAAVAELHSNFLSSKLTSISVSPLIDNKELTAW